MMDKKRLARGREFVEELSIGEAHLFLDLAVVFLQTITGESFQCRAKGISSDTD